jgi:hypothetical protein
VFAGRLREPFRVRRRVETKAQQLDHRCLPSSSRADHNVQPLLEAEVKTVEEPLFDLQALDDCHAAKYRRRLGGVLVPPRPTENSKTRQCATFLPSREPTAQT